MSELTETVVIDIETERHARRAEVKERIAACKVRKAQLKELAVEIRRIEAETDAKNNWHESQTTPLQAELAEINQREVENQIQGVIDPDAPKRRIELRQRLVELNNELEAFCETQDGLIKQLKREEDAIRRESKDFVQVLENELRNKLGNRVLKETQTALQFLVSQAHATAGIIAQKLATAEAWAEKSEEDQNFGDPEIYKQRCEHWRIASEELDFWRSRLESRSAENLQAMIDE